VELHVHLEGAMRPSTLLALARRNRVDLPADDVAGLREWFRFRDFDHFVEIYVACSAALKRPRISSPARRLRVDQARENGATARSTSRSARTG
jgi:adenosine deaminase